MGKFMRTAIVVLILEIVNSVRGIYFAPTLVCFLWSTPRNEAQIVPNFTVMQCKVMQHMSLFLMQSKN